MRSRLASCAVLFVVAASAVAAQQFSHVWLRVTPEGEEFAVHMPEPNFRIRRELPFGVGVTLKPASFEITHRGALFSVLSFSKSERDTPKSPDEFVKGFRHALGKGGVRAEPVAGRAPRPDGRVAGELRLAAGDRSGTARVFETQSRFYVVLSLAGTGAAVMAEHFQDSFTLDRAGADRVPLAQAAAATGPAVNPPAPLWPVVGTTGSTGVMVGDKTPGVYLPDVDTSKVDVSKPARRAVISGGVLNGKAVAKPQPVYPAIAKAARAQGAVTVQIIVDEEGYVIAAHAVSGHPLLQQASVFAARQARFTLTYLEGQPVKVSGVITYNFVLV
jgi:TonB family protein